MKQTVDFETFVTSFEKMNYAKHFSIKGLRALFEYFEESGKDVGIEIELDVIAICYEYSEYEHLEQFNSDYFTEFEEIEDIWNETFVIEFDGGFIIQKY